MQKTFICQMLAILLVSSMASASLTRNLQGDIQSSSQSSQSSEINPITHTSRLQDLTNEWTALNFSRSYDGSGNNLVNTDYGKLGYLLKRVGPHSYASDPFSRPNPRVISNTFGVQGSVVRTSRQRLSFLFTIFGQFIDHDFSSSSRHPTQTANIVVPTDDLFFTPGSEISFRRSNYTLDQQGVRQQFSVLSPWIDGGNIYGSNNATALSLRQLSGGRMNTTANGELLPTASTGFFIAGDSRVNQNLVLTSLHTIFVKFHNLICEKIILARPELATDDQTVYNIARNFVVGVFQNIVFNQWLQKLLPDGLGDYQYDPNINPSLDNQFSTAAFRFHSLLVGQIPRINKQGQVVQTYTLQNLFANPSEVNADFISQILRGASATLTKERSVNVVDDIRNFLTFALDRVVKTDLYSLNIQRGRDHGVPTYGQLRSALGLPPVNQDFKNFTNNKNVNNLLQQVYSSPNNMDLFIGILGEPKHGRALGEVGTTLVRSNFKRIRDGDRQYFQNPSVYPPNVANVIKNIKFFDVVRAVTTFNGIGQNLPDRDLFEVQQL